MPVHPAAAAAPRRAGGRRGTVILLLAVLGIISTVTLYLVSALGPTLVEEFDLSRAALGGLSTAMFVVAMGMSALAGRVEQLASPRTILLVTVGTGSASVLALGLSWGYGTLLAAMLVAGISVGLSNPIANTLIARGSTKEWHARLIMSKQMGSQVGALMCGLAVPAAAGLLGWRPAVLGMLLVGVAGVVLAMAPGVAGSSTDLGGDLVPGATSTSMPAALRVLVPYAVLMGFGLSSTVAFAPLFGFEVLGLGQSIAGVATAVIGAAGIASRLYWSWYTDRSFSAAGPLSSLAVVSGVAVGLFVGAAVLPVLNAPLYWSGVALAGFSTGAWATICMIVVVRCCPPPHLAHASGIIMMCGFAGIVIGPVLLGALIDHMGHYVMAWSVVSGLYALAAATTARATNLRPT